MTNKSTMLLEHHLKQLKLPTCWQPAKVAHFETREIMGWMEVWRGP